MCTACKQQTERESEGDRERGRERDRLTDTARQSTLAAGSSRLSGSPNATRCDALYNFNSLNFNGAYNKNATAPCTRPASAAPPSFFPQLTEVCKTLCATFGGSAASCCLPTAPIGNWLPLSTFAVGRCLPLALCLPRSRPCFLPSCPHSGSAILKRVLSRAAISRPGIHSNCGQIALFKCLLMHLPRSLKPGKAA